MKHVDLSGHQFGRLLALHRAPNRNGFIAYECRCTCGANTVVLGCNLRKGHTQSCGCLMRERISAANTTHGATAGRRGRPREYYTWSKMIQRCTNQADPNYQRYGARGIAVCDRWRLFENFIADMGPSPKGFTLDRVNNDGNYEPSNCRWADRRTQANNRRPNRLISHAGMTKTISEWARERGIKVSTLGMRINQYGWSVARALGE